MHGAAPPFMTGWAGLSPYDAYTPVAQSAQPAVPQHSVPVQPHVPILPPAVNPRFSSPMDTYFHQMLQGVPGYSHKPVLEPKHHIADGSQSLPGFHTHSKKTSDFDVHNNSSYNFNGDKWFHGSSKGTSFTEPVTTRDDFNFKFSPFHQLDGTNYSVSRSDINSSNPSTGLTWNNVFNSSVSTSTVSSSIHKPASTSVPTVPVASSKSAAPGNGIISYYSMPQERTNYLAQNSVEAASKEAARILEEAHQFTSGSIPLDRKQPSPFLNISNDVNRQQLHNGMLYPNPADELKKPRPASRQSSGSLPAKSPVDFRVENILPGGRPFNAPKDAVQDFWSQFGLPPPNVDLEKMPHCSEKRNNDVLHHSDGLLNSAKRAKHDHISNESTAEYSNDSIPQSSNETGAEKFLEERKKPEKLTRRKSFTDDPEIDALVEVKVQEIMAACRQNKDSHGVAEKLKVSKSPTSVKVPSKPLLKASDRVHSYQQVPPEQAIPATSEDLSNNKGRENVFDFTDCDEPKKGFSYQVRDMIHVKPSESRNNSSPIVQHSQNVNHWPKFEAPKEGQYIKSVPNGTYSHSYPNINESYHMNQSSLVKRDPYGHSYIPGVNKSNIESKEQPLSSLPLHQINMKKNNIPDGFQVPSDIYSNDNKKFEFNTGYNKSNNKLDDQKCLPKVQGTEGFNSGRVSPCCGNCSRLGVRFSENCQNHAKRNKLTENIKHDPYQFCDDSNNGNQWNGMNKLNAKRQHQPTTHQHGIKGSGLAGSWNSGMKHEMFVSDRVQSMSFNGDVKHKVQYNNGFGNMTGGKMQHLERDRDIYMKQGYKPEKSQKVRQLSTKFDKTQGNNVNKKMVGKSYGMKSSLALLKKSQKFQQSRTSALKRKWVNNPNYKKIPKDDFAEKLKKNLGLPPLTLMDMMTKKSSNLPKAYLKRRLKSVTSVNENQISKANDLNTGLSTNQIECSSQQKMKPVQRSRSADGMLSKDGTSDSSRPRSHSVDNNVVNTQNNVPSTPGLSVKVDDNLPFAFNHEKVKSLSEHINGLRDQVTGNASYLETNSVIDVPKCGCLGPDGVCLETVEGPYYTQLGVGRSVEAIRTVMEKRTGVTGKAIRIEKVRYTGKEGKSTQGCPIAKWIVRRSSEEEKYLTIVRHRVGHFCENAWIVIGLVAWEGIPSSQADHLYDFLSETLPSHGNETERRCGTNDRKTCACQGADLMKRGASFSFGCSWSMYFNGCKFARSTHVRKFRLKNEDKESVLESKLQDLAGHVGPLYKKCAPSGHANQCHFSEKAQDCRLGYENDGPFSGVTACVDFCAHAHKDIHNMNNGSTVVVTLTKHRGLSKPDDEQLHVLPLYVLEPTDESGSYEGQYQKIQKGSLEVLHQYPLEARMRAFPLESCKKRRLNKKAGKAKNGVLNGCLSPWDSSSSTQSTPKKGRPDPYHSTTSLTSSTDNTPVKQRDLQGVNLDVKSDRPVSLDDLRSMSSQADTAALYDKFWDYYYAFGVFPPSSILAANSISSSKSSDNSACQPSLDCGKQIDQNNCALPWQQVSNMPHSVPSSSTLSHSRVSNHSQVKHSDDGGYIGYQPVNNGSNSTQPQGKPTSIPQHSASGEQNMSNSMNRSDVNKGSDQNSQLGAVSESTIVPQSQLEMQSQQSALDLSHSSSSFMSTQAGDQTMSSMCMDKGSKPLSGENKSSQDNDVNILGLISSGTAHGTVDHQTASHLRNNRQSVPDQHSSTPTPVGQQFPGSSHNQTMCRNSFSISSLVQNSDRSKSNLEITSNHHHLPGNMSSSNASLSTNLQTSGGSDNRNMNQLEKSNSYSSPLDLLSRTVNMHSKDVGFTGTLKYSGVPSGTLNLNSSHSNQEMPLSNVQSSFQKQSHSVDQENNSLRHDHNPLPYMNNQLRDFPLQAQNIPSNNQFWNRQGRPEPQNRDVFSIPSTAEPSHPDPDVVKCEMEYNEDAFQDPDVGGVAIALSHGAVLFEVAKRELHATTGLRNPNRYHPTRISLVFYQHKNLNTERHGMYAYENKLDCMKMKRIEKMQLERGYVDMKEIENSFKGGKKRKLTDEEIEVNELLRSSSGEYKYMWQCNAKMADTATTSTISTKWIDPSPMVTGPYQKWK